LSTAGLDFNYADLIVRERKENGSFTSFSDYVSRMRKRNAEGRINISNFSSQLGKSNVLNKKGKLDI